jgi:hypothetical protein
MDVDATPDEPLRCGGQALQRHEPVGGCVHPESDADRHRCGVAVPRAQCARDVAPGARAREGGQPERGKERKEQ